MTLSNDIKNLNRVSLPTILSRSKEYKPCVKTEDGTILNGFCFLSSNSNQEIIDWAHSQPDVTLHESFSSELDEIIYAVTFANEDLVSYYKLTFL